MNYWSRYYYRPFPRQMFPPVSIDRFQQSANESRSMCVQLEQLCRKIANDATFAKQVKDAAQQSQQKEVERLISSVITLPKEVRFTPDGIVVEMETKKEANQPPLGRNSISLRW